MTLRPDICCPTRVSGRLLLIEDSPVQAREVAVFLRRAGYEVVIAHDGESGLVQLSESRFDLLLCDLHLPGMNGFDVCRRVKATNPSSPLPVILLTRWADPLNVLRGLEAGADGFISKGQRRTEIIERVNRVITRAKKPPASDTEPAQVVFLNAEFHLTAKRDQLLEVLLAGFEDTVYLNEQFEQEMKERLEAQAAAREKDDQLRALFETAVDGILSADSQGIIQSFNPAAERIFGYSADEVLGTNVARLIFSAEGDQHDRPVCPCFQTDESTKSAGVREAFARHKNGDVFPIDLSVSKTRTAVTRYTAFVRDISDRKQAEHQLHTLTSELQRSNRELEQFAYVISHDLKEPLRMVSSFTRLLHETLGSGLTDDAARYLEHIQDGAARMRMMIDDLLTYSRVGMGHRHNESVNLMELLDEVLANLAAAINDSGAQIHIAPLPEVIGTRSLLLRLFQNLIGNAIKFRGPNAPVIHVGVEDVNNGWEFFVRDNGIGIPPKFQTRVFQIFQRLHKREAYEGTGVGLAVCRKIVEQHGGTIWIESQPGEGTTFHFTLRHSTPLAQGRISTNPLPDSSFSQAMPHPAPVNPTASPMTHACSPAETC